MRKFLPKSCKSTESIESRKVAEVTEATTENEGGISFQELYK
jgi:hypothetical protein